MPRHASPATSVAARSNSIGLDSSNQNRAETCAIPTRETASRWAASPGRPVSSAITSAMPAKRAPTVASGPMGPDARLVGVLAARLATAGLAPDDGVVLAAAGSSDPRAAGDVETVAAGLRAQLPNPVVAGFGAAAQPTVADAVAGLRADGCPRVVIASYLLAPGYFHDRLGEAGADLVSAPLAPHPGLAGLVLDRYDTGRAALPT